MNKIYKCQHQVYHINYFGTTCFNKADMIVIIKVSNVRKLYEPLCERCYNKFYEYNLLVTKTNLPVSAIDDIENILSILEDD